MIHDAHQPVEKYKVSVQDVLTIAMLVHTVENSLVMNDEQDPVTNGDAGAFGLDEVRLLPH